MIFRLYDLIKSFSVIIKNKSYAEGRSKDWYLINNITYVRHAVKDIGLLVRITSNNGNNDSNNDNHSENQDSDNVNNNFIYTVNDNTHNDKMMMRYY